jgi:very-short-patch-repair endonuclease/predicted transcriptional regulator of viral defense system
VSVERRAYDANRSNHSPDEALADLAGRQHGVVAREQLTALGFTRDAVRRRVERKRLQRLHPGVYAVGHDALTSDSRRLAAVMACGPGALLSHRAAGAAQGLLSSSPRFDVTVRHARAKREGLVIHRSRVIHPDDRSTVRGIPVTSVARTLVDLADALSEERLAKAVHEAEVQRVFDLRAVEAVVGRLPGRAGRRRLRRVLAAYRPDPHFLRSEAERRFKRLCERHHLPQPQFNINVAGYEVDAYWPDASLAVEVDGAETHHTRRAFHEDRARDRRLAGYGIRVVRLTSRDLDDDVGLAAELRAIRAAAALAAGSRPAPACA